MSHAFGLPPRSDRVQRLKRKCPECGGWDVGAVGFIMHKSDCPKAPCFFCGLEIMPGERRATQMGTAGLRHPCHYDCLVDFEHDRDKEDHA